MSTIQIALPFQAPLLAIALGLWSGCAFAKPVTSASAPALTSEDIVEAYERGDLSYDELQDILALLESFVPGDSVLLLAVDNPALFWGNSMAPPDTTSSSPSVGPSIKIRYQTYSAIRGDASSRQSLKFDAGTESLRLNLDLGRHANASWQANRTHIQFEGANWSIKAGSIQPHWTGGLLTGPAPRFMVAPSGFGESLIQPRLARLVGVSVRAGGHRSQVEALHSSRADYRLRHTASGMRVSFSTGPISLEHCIVRQRILDLPTAQSFNAVYGGLSLIAKQVGQMSGQTDIAIAEGNLAAQTSWKGAGHSFRWQVEAWNIAPGFRNPLMFGQAESDRESVVYPEIDRSLSSTSSGEQGGELNLRLDQKENETDLRVTWWREGPYRPGAVKASVAHTSRMRTNRLRLLYAIRHTPGFVDAELRHKCQIRLQLTNLWLSAGARLTHRFVTGSNVAGGQFKLGHKSSGQGMGEAGVSASIDYYDFARAGVFTLQYSNTIQLSAYRHVRLHLRWRSPYGGRPTLFTLRLNTQLTI